MADGVLSDDTFNMLMCSATLLTLATRLGEEEEEEAYYCTTILSYLCILPLY
jgi:hypothetical protein